MIQKPKIKLIIFDAYGVCVMGGYPQTSKALAKKFGGKWQDYFEVFYTKYFNQAALKKISQRQAWEKAIKEMGLPVTVDEVKKLHYSFIRPNKEVLEVAAQLKSHHQILLLSKNTRSQFKDLHQQHPEIQEVFGKDMINTWEYDLPKASRETVYFVCKRYKVRPEEIVYTDDQIENLVEPKALGVHTIFFKNFKQFKRELARAVSV